jgi:uroporphyrinogen decarboxylase
LSGGIPDRVPVSIVSSAWVFSTYGLDLQTAYKDAEKMTEVWRSFNRDFGADAIVLSLSSTVIPSYFGTTWKFPKSGFPLLVEPAVKEMSELEELHQIDPSKDEQLQACYKHGIQLVEDFGAERCIWFMTTGPLSNAARITETEFMMECLIEEPDFVRDLFRFSVDAWKIAVEPILEMGVDVVDFSSSPGSPDLISPRMYREFFWEFDREVVQWIHDHEAKAVFHICGNTLRIIEDMAKTRANGLSIDSMLDMFLARKAIGKKTALVGNLDPANILMNGTPDDVIAASLEAMKSGGINGGFVLAPGCDVPPTCPRENIAAMINTAKEHGVYPLSY